MEGASKLPCEKKDLFVPPLQEVADVLAKGLKSNFEQVDVSVVDCPNLTEPPFTLVTSGICGNPKVVDLGGPPYLLPLARKDKVYNIVDICKTIGSEKCLVIGAGAGPWPYIGVNCEGIFNLYIDDGSVKNESRISKVNVSTDKPVQEILPNSEPKCALLANLFCSDGKQGKVLKVNCKKRKGSQDFISSMRSTLIDFYGDKIIGIGGTFLLKEGKAKQHVMPAFSTTPILSDDEVNQWLKFYEMSAPLIAVGTLVTGDYDLDLRVQHFHSFSHHGEGGHYHYDTTPETVEYLGYFSLADEIYRVDRPQVTHKIGRD